MTSLWLWSSWSRTRYDADAENVDICFTQGDPDGPVRIVVSDDGHGMDVETVLGDWLEPGTSSKKRSRRSPGGRVLQGEKGIGRFAAARLGDSLLLETKRKGTTELVNCSSGVGALSTTIRFSMRFKWTMKSTTVPTTKMGPV